MEDNINKPEPPVKTKGLRGHHVRLKTCSKCGLEKRAFIGPNSEFGRDSHTKDGFYSSCKECRHEKWNETRDDQLPRQRAYHKGRYRAKREEIVARRKTFYDLHPENKKASNKKYYAENKPKWDEYKQKRKMKKALGNIQEPLLTEED